MSQRIDIELGDRSYAVHVGPDLLTQAGSLLAPFARGRVAVVTDSNVASLYLDRLLGALRGPIDAKPIVLEPGEGTKSFEGLERLTDELLAAGIERDGLVVAFGGGVIGDLAGFAAGVLKRGVEFRANSHHAPGAGGFLRRRQDRRSMRAKGKNLVGLFHQPRIVIADSPSFAHCRAAN